MYNCKVICDSVGPNDARLTTFEITFPRIILAEVNTHKMLSKNSASSRAIPVEKMLRRVEEDPFIPIYWGANQKGMVAEEELNSKDKLAATAFWKLIINSVVHGVKNLLDLGIHKQITNRWLEPALWHTCIISGTHWENMFNLRDNKHAQPEFREIAHMMKEIYRSNTPNQLKSGEYHLPYVTGYDLDQLKNTFSMTINSLKDISVGRCAAVTYLNQDGNRDPIKDLERASKLTQNGHLSPFEHVARALDQEEWALISANAYIKWTNKKIPIGNFWGWEQYRKTIKNEDCFPEPK